MVVISGNITLIARATLMVLTCKESSGVTPTGNANWNPGAATATGALAAISSASEGVAIFGALGGSTGPWLGGVAAGVSTRDGSAPWA